MSTIVLFEEKQVRRTWDKTAAKWYFAIVDVIAVLTDSANPPVYWRVMKKRLTDEGSETVTKCNALKMPAADGKQRLTDVADTEQLLRLIQSIPSRKAEPFKLWLARVGYERLEEIENPELAARRMRELYRQKGYSSELIEKRICGIAVRYELTDIWKKRGVTWKGTSSDPFLCPIQIALQVFALEGTINTPLDSLLLELSPIQSEQLSRLASRQVAAFVVIENHRRRDRMLKVATLAFGESNHIFRQGNSNGHNALNNAKPKAFRKTMLQRGRALAGAEISQVKNHGVSSTQLQRSRARESAEKSSYCLSSCLILAAIKISEQHRAEKSSRLNQSFDQGPDPWNHTRIFAGHQNTQAANKRDSLAGRQPPRRQIIKQDCQFSEMRQSDCLRFATTKHCSIARHQTGGRSRQIYRFQDCAARQCIAQNPIRRIILGRHFSHNTRGNPYLSGNNLQQIRLPNSRKTQQHRAVCDNWSLGLTEHQRYLLVVSYIL